MPVPVLEPGIIEPPPAAPVPVAGKAGQPYYQTPAPAYIPDQHKARVEMNGESEAKTPPSSSHISRSIDIHIEPDENPLLHHALCSCSQPAICLPTLVCPCVTYGKTQHRLNQRAARLERKVGGRRSSSSENMHDDDKNNDFNNSSTAASDYSYRAINASCLVFGLLLCCTGGILTAIQHTRIRKTYDMR
ncbi:hypothetical protein DV735_g1581, partial [Chaetothyriales sp. CBS 134920]